MTVIWRLRIARQPQRRRRAGDAAADDQGRQFGIIVYDLLL